MGRDNSTGQLLNGLAGQAGDTFNQDSINTNIGNGVYGLVVRITKYNGSPNDTNVSVAIFVSDGTPVPDGGTDGPTPTWNGTDVWTLDSTSVVSTGGNISIPRFYDPNAYVANGTLVASIDFPLTLGGGSGAGLVTINLTGGFVTASIQPALGSYELNDGQLVGRWATGELLAAISVLSLGGSNLCPDTEMFSFVKGLSMRRRRRDRGRRRPTRSSPCSALSLVAGFTAAPAVEGPVVTKTPGVSPCVDAGDAGDCF